MNYAERKLRNARAQVVHAHPFFGALLLRQRVVESTKCETLATDGDNLYFNPLFVEKLQADELHAVIAHEALHPGLGHHVRRGQRNHKLWNEACDYVINLVLDDCKFKLPKERLLDQKYRGMTAEQVYAILPRSNGGGGSSGSGADANQGSGTMPSYGGCGCVLDAPVANEEQRQAKEAEWRVATAQAATAARAAGGEVPGSLDVALRAVLEPRADWRDLLRRYMSQFAKADYSWRSPNRRFVADGLYLPSLHSEALSPVLLVIDASGSMPDESLTAAASEISSICSMLQPEWVDVIVHDTRVTWRGRFEPGDEIEIDVSARGGTKFAPVCDFVNGAEDDYSVVVWFTDLMPADWSTATQKQPVCPVLWIDYADTTITPPFGDDVVRMPKDVTL